MLQPAINGFCWTVTGYRTVEVSKDALDMFFSVFPKRFTSMSSAETSGQ